MARGPLYEPNYKPQFSGHETFPLRYGWLKKGFDAVYATEASPKNKSVFSDDEAIARFGVGKNMVTAIRHWLAAADFVEDKTATAIRTKDLGRMILAEGGLDPYLENPSTLWLIHWQLSAGKGEKTTWYWVFNHFHSDSFDREHIFHGLSKLAAERLWTVASATLKRDVECFIRTYVAKPASGRAIYEETLESPLAELGLVKPIGKRDGFRLVRGAKASLKAGIFLHALADFWEEYTPSANTLSFEAVAHEPGSPGRAFLLGENDLLDYLTDIEDCSNGVFKWSETAGLKQVIRVPQRWHRKKQFLKMDYQ